MVGAMRAPTWSLAPRPAGRMRPSTCRFHAWNVHGGFEFLSLGDTAEAFNAGEQQKLVGSVGIGFSY